MILLQGSPGSGKSVALRHVATQLADRAARSRRVNSIIPLYVNLKGLRREDRDAPIDADLIQAYVDTKLREGGTVTVDRFLDDEFERSVADGTFFFLFDSFDEIPDVLGSTELDEIVLQYSEAIAVFLRGMRRCRGVIASREFRSPQGLVWPLWRIAPLDDRRQRRLIRKALTNRDKEAALYGGLETADADLADLASNPMFLSLLCNFVDSRGRFPPSIHAVIEEYIAERLTVDKERLARRFHLTPLVIRAVGERTAICMATNRQFGLEPRVSELVVALQETGVAPSVARTGLNALEWVKLAQGEELTADGERSFSFAHRRFQEYFATCAVLSGGARVPSVRLLTDWRWRETAVALLQLQAAAATDLLGEAATLLREDVSDPRAPEIENTSSSSDATADPRPRLSVWSGPVPHLLGLLQSGFAANPDDLPSDLRRAAGSILTDVYTHGDTYERKLAVTVAGVAPAETFSELLRSAFSGRSEWLREAAYRQTARLGSVPPDIGLAVRRVVVGMAADLSLWSKRLSTSAQVRRLGSTDVTHALWLALLAEPVDLIAHVFAIAAFASGTRQAGIFGAGALLVAAVVVSFISLPIAFITRGPIGFVVATVGLEARLFVGLAAPLAAHSTAAKIGAGALAVYALSWAPAAYVAGRLAVRLPTFAVLVPQAYALSLAVRWVGRFFASRGVRKATILALYAATLAMISVIASTSIGQIVSIVFAGVGAVSASLFAVALLWRWCQTAGVDLMWYRGWRRSGPRAIRDPSVLLALLERQRSARGAVRLLQDVRTEGLVEPSRGMLEVLTDLSRVTARLGKAVVTGDRVWISAEFAAWLAHGDGTAGKALKTWGQEVDDELAQLRETMTVQVSRTEHVQALPTRTE